MAYTHISTIVSYTQLCDIDLLWDVEIWSEITLKTGVNISQIILTAPFDSVICWILGRKSASGFAYFVIHLSYLVSLAINITRQ